MEFCYFKCKLCIISKAGIINWINDKLIDKFHKNDYRYRFAKNRSFDFCVCYFTVFILSILYLKFEQIQFTTQCCV